MIEMQPLTKRQREVFDFCAEFITRCGFAPSLDEICDRFSLSLSTVHKHLENLRMKGYVMRAWNRSRSLRLLVQDGCCPTCGRLIEKSLDEAKVPLEIGRKSDIMGSTSDASTSAVPTTTEVP